jgi:hypothetical protein
MTLQSPEICKERSIRVFVDAHVHIHDRFDLQKFFNAAARNFAFHASKSVPSASNQYVLCLTESCGADKFGELASRAECIAANEKATEAVWTFGQTGDERWLVATHPALGKIEIVAGRQIVTAERLEILALGSIGEWEDDIAASDTIKSVISSGAVPVLPWGFGKWLGRRRRAVDGLINAFDDGSLYLGDNSGRPGIFPNPAEFMMARGSGMRILPGSDPLPFASEYDRAGSFGFYVDHVADCDEGVWPGLCRLLQQGQGNLHSYGSLESSLRFARNQVAMQYLTRVSHRQKAS